MAKVKRPARRIGSKANETGTIETAGVVSVDIKWLVPEGFPITYADQAVVQHFPDEFIVSFFQSSHPVLMKGADIKALKEIPAHCVARFALSPEQMARLSQVMVQNFNKWKEKQEEALLPDAMENAK